jgi:hypothetical protein
MNLTSMKAAGKLAAHKNLLKLRKHSPTILMTAGLVGMVTTTVLASKATLKLESVMDGHDEKLLEIKSFRANVAEIDDEDKIVMKDGRTVVYTDEDYKRDMVILHARTAGQVAKLYWMPAAVGVVSIAAIVGGHVQLTKRNAALAATVTSLQLAFNKYRERVVEQFGADKDKEFARPREQVVEVENKETGEVREEFQFDPNGLSLYARFFDEYNIQWRDEPGYNLLFLRSQQNYANDLLKSRGHVFLNEVYDMLKMERSKEGSVVGWILGEGDDFVDFGIYSAGNERAREFVNGYEKSILLDFNVSGLIYNKIAD